MLSEADLGKIYTAQYRTLAASTDVAMAHSHSMGVSGNDIAANKKVYKGASRKAFSKTNNLAGFGHWTALATAWTALWSARSSGPSVSTASVCTSPVATAS